MNSLKIGAVILARMSSTRLPGKVLIEVDKQPMLNYILQRLRNAIGLNIPIVLATSEHASDNRLASYAKTHGISLFRGKLESVLQRVVDCGHEFNFDYVIRVNADSPFISEKLFQRGLVAAKSVGEFDLITNLLPRTYPYGISFELINVSTLKQILSMSLIAKYHEHPTKYLYDFHENFIIHNIENQGSLISDAHYTIDTSEDLNRFVKFIKGNPSWMELPFGTTLKLYQETEIKK